MTEVSGAAVSNEPVVAALPTPISVEPRVAPAGEATEIARQADEARVAKDAPVKTEPAKDDTKKPSGSIKESLAKARAKIEADPTPAKAISVAAKDAPADAKAAEPVAAAKDTKAAEPAAVARGEDGKFVSTKPAAEGKVDTKTATDAAGAKVASPADKDAPAPVAAQASKPSHTAEPPPARMSAKAKEEWAALPEESRAEVKRMEKEFTAGFAKYKDAAERDASLGEFHERATKGGTTVKEALSKYVAMEDLIRKDPIAGLNEIAKNVGLSLRDVAAKILNQPADQVQSAAEKRVAALENEILELKKGFGGIQAERQRAATDTTTEAVTKFAAENPRFEELADDIAFFLKSGRTKDLAEAYKLAERLNPAPAPAKVEATTETVAAASSAAAPALKLVPPAPSSDAGTRSIAGTPTAGSDPVQRQPSSSIKEAIRKAAARAG